MADRQHEPPQDQPEREAGDGVQRRSKGLPFGLLRGLYIAPGGLEPDDDLRRQMEGEPSSRDAPRES